MGRELRRGLASARAELSEDLDLYATQQGDNLDRTCTELREIQALHSERLTKALTDRFSERFAQQMERMDARLHSTEQHFCKTEELQRGAFEELVVDAAMASGEALVRATRALGAEVAMERKQRTAEQARSEQTLEVMAENCVATMLSKWSRDGPDPALSSATSSAASAVPSLLSIPL